jgi:hypothetical protein
MDERYEYQFERVRRVEELRGLVDSMALKGWRLVAAVPSERGWIKLPARLDMDFVVGVFERRATS